MTTKVVQLDQFSKVLGDYSHLNLTETRKGVVSGIARSIPMLVQASPVDTGLYAQSWDMTSDEQSATLGNYAPHAPIIEFGARPFTPPLKPLLEWAKRVTKSPSQPPEYDKHVWALAIYTRNKIQAEGMKPRHILENALPAIIENIKEELSKLG
jgi:hypothetical protein